VVLVIYLEIRDLIQHAWNAYWTQSLTPQPVTVPVARALRPKQSAKTFSLTR
jgi:hypothetical protein